MSLPLEPLISESSVEPLSLALVIESEGNTPSMAEHEGVIVSTLTSCCEFNYIKNF